MNKILSLALVVGGIVLLVFGFNASDSIGSHFSRFFTGNPTDRTIWLLIGGFAAVVIGAIGLLRPSKAT